MKHSKDQMPEIFCAAYPDYIDRKGKIPNILERSLVVSLLAKTCRHAAAKKSKVEMMKIMDDKKWEAQEG